MERTTRAAGGHRLLIVDDHPLVRQGLRLLIDRQNGLSVVAEAADAPQALAEIARTKPDLAIVDISLKGTDGLELTKTIRQRFPRTAVLVLSMYDETIYAERALKAGARGYIMKREANEELLTAITRVLRGMIYLNESFSNLLLERIVGKGARDDSTLLVGKLTDRELEVLRLIGQGRTNQEIARALALSGKTVQTYKEHIKKKLDLRSAAALANYAINWLQT